MAAAEARAAWQRTANRCFVQEDAKRAPRLACCPSSSSSTKQVDAGPGNGTDGHDNPNLGFMPLSRNPSYSNLSPESRWWLQLQPNYGYQMALPNEQSNTLEAKTETVQADFVNSSSEYSVVHPQIKDDVNSTSATCTKKDTELEKKELKTVFSRSAGEPLVSKCMGESYELLEMDVTGCSVSKQVNELGFDSDSSWMGAEKTEPWWRVSDRDELASLVAQRSLDLIENCDLPRPQHMHLKKDPCAYIEHFDQGGILPSFKDLKAQTGGLSSPTVGFAVGSACAEQCASLEEQLHYGSDSRNSKGPSPKGVNETHNFDADPSKAQLLEALRHSQTRAREAEKAAKQAYAEKEHILKLFFRQASQLFAYKQWFQLLQLENLYLQIKNNQQPISTLFPMVLPWMPHKAGKQQKSRHKPARGRRGKRGHPRHEVSKFTVAVALGLSLVGAGLLLGWTVGWMLPTF